MNEQTTQLLQSLADKLGTTAEHLWAVLVRQAPINGVVTLVQFALLGAYLYWLLGLRDRSAQWFDDAPPKFVGYCVAWAIAAIVSIAAFFSLPELAASFFNPEYWALDRILDAAKAK